MAQLEATDNQAANATMDNSAVFAGMKFQEDYHNGADARLIKVADAAPQAPSDAPAGADGAPKDPVAILLTLDPKDLSPALQTLQGLAGHFDKADDKAKAITEIKAEVEKTIAAADDNKAKTLKEVQTEGTALQPQIEKADASMKAAQAAVQAAFEKVPEADQKHVGAELELLRDPKTGAHLKAAIEADLASHPGLVPAARGFIAAEKVAMPVMLKAQALQEKMEAAADDPEVTRLVYADMLAQAGDKAGAQEMQGEAMALHMHMTIDQFHKLQELQKQQKQQGGPGAPAKPDDK
jgi:hypothetical protein